jgi:hypothetical protein
MSAYPYSTTAVTLAGTGVIIGTALQISATQFWTQLATVTSTNNAINLPINPTAKSKYHITNNGAYSAQVFPAMQDLTLINSLLVQLSF